ncbi:MAG: DNA-binding response regulator [Phycisphaerales bacterium]|nr:MAG: DNA-binding response regulator [Phycisphaerales bacterium]
MPGLHQTAPCGATELVRALTKREREVLTLIARGLTSVEIADWLHRSIKTVETHRCALGRKLHVRNRVELTHLAIEAGLVDRSEFESPSSKSGSVPAALSDQATRLIEVLTQVEERLAQLRERDYLQHYVEALREHLAAEAVIVEGRCRTSGAMQLAAAGTAIHDHPYASDFSPSYCLGVGEIRIWDSPFPNLYRGGPWTISDQTVSIASTMILGPDGHPIGSIVLMSATPLCDVQPLRCCIDSGQHRLAQEIAAASQLQ